MRKTPLILCRSKFAGDRSVESLVSRRRLPYASRSSTSLGVHTEPRSVSSFSWPERAAHADCRDLNLAFDCNLDDPNANDTATRFKPFYGDAVDTRQTLVLASSIRPCSVRLPTSCRRYSLLFGTHPADSGYSAWPAINRKAIGAMATIGALESAYLTYQKINPAGLDLLCGASGGCLDVLNGPYASVLVRLAREPVIPFLSVNLYPFLKFWVSIQVFALRICLCPPFGPLL